MGCSKHIFWSTGRVYDAPGKSLTAEHGKSYCFSTKHNVLILSQLLTSQHFVVENAEIPDTTKLKEMQR